MLSASEMYMEPSLFCECYNTQIQVGAEEKLKQEVLLWVWWSEGSAWRVRNRVLDRECNSATKTRLRSIILEMGVTRERHEGVRDILKEESFS